MNLEKAILSTLAYHNIFNYPLSLSEIDRYLIQNNAKTENILKKLKKEVTDNKIGERGGYFYLKDKKNIVEIRKSRFKLSKSKFKKAKFYLLFLKLIPSVKLVAVSGALAMNNCTKNDDIDFFIITAKNTLWTTRLLSNLILLPYKRKPISNKQKDKACLNIFIEESSLKIKEQNLYVAHEIVQLKPIFCRQNTYSDFIKANSWIFKYLPNWKPDFEANKTKSTSKINNHGLRLFEKVTQTLETLLKNLQLQYMKSKITTEIIKEKQLFFHPLKTQTEILTKYKNNTKNL